MVKKILTVIDKGVVLTLKTIIVITAAGMLTLMVIQILFRYFLLIPSPWSEDLARLCLVWSTFLAAALGIRNLEHPTLDMVTKHFPIAIQDILKIIIYLSISFFGFILVYYGSLFAWATRIDRFTSLQYPKNFFYWPGPVGGFFFIVYSCKHIVAAAVHLAGKSKKEAQ